MSISGIGTFVVQGGSTVYIVGGNQEITSECPLDQRFTTSVLWLFFAPQALLDHAESSGMHIQRPNFHWRLGSFIGNFCR